MHRRRQHHRHELDPAHAGMFPAVGMALVFIPARPRARGDVPVLRTGDEEDPDLDPAHAGMFRVPRPRTRRWPTRPRARGDVPYLLVLPGHEYNSTPRTRGCSAVPRRHRPRRLLDPAHAGMFHARPAPRISPTPRPRARGDVPRPSGISWPSRSSTPRTRGCSAGDRVPQPPAVLDPAHAGMFPGPRGWSGSRRARPRARGDVPREVQQDRRLRASTPRTRGCSRTPVVAGVAGLLDPAHAGMFPPTGPPGRVRRPRPRARGDVPRPGTSPRAGRASTPRTRGCSATISKIERAEQLDPAHAGMFRWGSVGEPLHPA